MSAFTGPLDLRHLDLDWRRWQLLTPLTYEIGSLGSGKAITVPAGFVTDGASVPRPLWWLLPSWGRYSRAAVLHDFTARSIDDGKPHPLVPTKRKSDHVFLEAMKVSGVSLPVRWTMFAAVRLASMTVLRAPRERDRAE